MYHLPPPTDDDRTVFRSRWTENSVLFPALVWRSSYFTTTFLPSTMFTPLRGAVSRWPERE